MRQPRYVSTEHTADIGLVAYGDAPKEAFENAAFGLFDLMVDLSDVTETEEIGLRVEADDTAGLLVAFLNELLFIFETRRLVLTRFEIVDWNEETNLSAKAWGAPLSTQEPREQVKACTYHDVRVERTGEGYEAEVLLDV